ncbi:MAG: DMT family transporter [Kiloniellaceae bacterium]
MVSSTPPSATGAATVSGDRPLVGILLLVGAMSVVPFMDVIAKQLSGHLPVLQLVWARYFFHFCLIFPVVLLRYGPRRLIPPQPLLQLVRGTLLLASTILFFAAIAQMPLADALALIFVSPLIVTALSPWVLGETVGLRRKVAVLVGFLGALLIVRPGIDAIQWPALLALGAGVVFGLYLLTTRRLAGSAPPLVTLTYSAAAGALLMSFAVPAGWVMPDATDLAGMVMLGAIAAGGHFLLIKSFDFAPASLLAPFTYSEIIMTTLLGFVFFGDFPNAWTWAGIAVIIASGIYISLRERVRGAPPSAPDKTVL